MKEAEAIQDLEFLRAAVADCSERVARSGASRILALSVELGECDPLGVFSQLGGGDRFYWEQAAQGIAFAACGAVLEVEAASGHGARDGAGILSVRDSIARAYRRVDVVGKAAPIFVGGFAFDSCHRAEGEWSSFPAGRMVLPELLIRREDEVSTATLCLEVENGVDPAATLEVVGAGIERARSLAGAVLGESRPHAQSPPVAGDSPLPGGAEYRVRADRAHDVYREQVTAALSAIGRAELEKVVLARSLEVIHPGRFQLPGFLAELRQSFPHCTVLACGRGEDTLVAASPELLLSLHAGKVRTRALAGSAPRGESPEEDAELGSALRESKKEQAEHEAVVRAIRGALAQDCGELEGPEAPELLRVKGIQHLATSLRGRLQGAHDKPGALDLLARLHPTPAVGGLPRERSLDWIAEHEGLDRGWYAGPVGWVDAEAGGEFWLALRSALIRNPAPSSEPDTEVAWARLFAGAGIVEGSVPESELRETRLKLRALLAPLTEI